MKKVKNKKKKILAASVAGLLAVAGSAAVSTALFASDEVACMGINSCKGTAACASKTSSCAGMNACKGQGWIKVESADVCTKKGGHVVTPAM